MSIIGIYSIDKAARHQPESERTYTRSAGYDTSERLWTADSDPNILDGLIRDYSRRPLVLATADRMKDYLAEYAHQSRSSAFRIEDNIEGTVEVGEPVEIDGAPPLPMKGQDPPEMPDPVEWG